jgi:hypothetical protein
VSTQVDSYISEWAAGGHELEETQAEIQRFAEVGQCS